MNAATVISSYKVSLGDLVGYLYGILDTRPDFVRLVAYPGTRNYNLQWQFGGKTQKAHFVLDLPSPPSSIRDLLVRDLESYITWPIESRADGTQHFYLTRRVQQ